VLALEPEELGSKILLLVRQRLATGYGIQTFHPRSLENEVLGGMAPTAPEDRT
jgi:hypothetical protein